MATAGSSLLVSTLKAVVTVTWGTPGLRHAELELFYSPDSES